MDNLTVGPDGIADGIDKLIEDYLENDLEIECPECGGKFNPLEIEGSCPHCGVPIRIEI